MMPIWPIASSILPGRRTFPFPTSCRGGCTMRLPRRIVVAFCKALRQRACDRKRRRCRQHVGHGGRRSVRVRRYQGRGARGQASCDGRGNRSAGAGACHRGPRGDGGDLCLRSAAWRRCAPVSRWSRMPARSGGWARGLPNGPAAPRAMSSTRRRCRNAVESGSVTRPGADRCAIKAAFHAEKAGGLVRLAKDVGRVGEKAGMRGALDTLEIAEGPEDVARAARLAEVQGRPDPRDP